MKIIFTKRFEKQYSSASIQIQNKFEEKLNIFLKNKYDKVLNNHSLKGKLKGHRSINITGDWRAIFKESKNEECAYFVLLGRHSELYN
ncbi:MAG: type II toxin-antitoxin system mRNA interferase toxin, RelE/StbE family [Candidatus Pacebacteria bacterium]|jgi:addiction module RelE/StbE family toxin|nr:type II toxin-antitoxin system mRNA interferase toxin, RelE/StbE family [Candidatus Paceibacterota bacterium]MDD5013077.1 type II toxin-antitoxin system mRNA interferase toxin, RelE/StbE family [Candidatus Paceibacterota bacterium]MDD5753090.1 type II toxin-antitoxin system mRNA interferase toxin, RelE/StbE family [Candidatus Paceibacterota bacterium]